MAIQGLRDTENFVTNQRPQNWRQGMLYLYPNGKMPLTGMTSLMKSEATDDPRYNWWEKALDAQRLQVDTTYNSSIQTINVASGAKALKEGTILRVEHTGEVMRVSADPVVDTSISVVRGFSGSTATAVTIGGAGVNPYIQVIGSAYEEGSLAPTGIAYDPSDKYNYTQIFRNALEATRTASKTRLRTPDAVKEAKRECLEYHGIEIERALIFGKRYQTTHNGKPLRTTGGVIEFIDSNNIVDNAGSNVNMETLEGWLKRMFDFGSTEKVALCGNTFVLAVQQIVRKNASIQIMSGIKEFGMDVMRLICPFGTLVLKTHPLFNQVTGGTVASTAYYGMDSWALVLDMTNIKYRYFSGDDTRYEKKLESNDLDGMKSGYLSECGLEVHHPKTHFLLKGVTRGVADT